MASWGRPISTVLSATCVLEILPRVEPPAMSERLAEHGSRDSVGAVFLIGVKLDHDPAV